MTVSKNNTKEVLVSLDCIFKEYDAIFTSFVSLSSANVIKSKNKILKHVRTIITNTFSDVILLKKAAGKDNIQYVHIINEIYKRVYDGVILVYNHEFNALNNIVHSKKVILAINLTPYIVLLLESSKNISSIDCEIKRRINDSLDVIKQNRNYLQNLKLQIKNRSFSRAFRDILFGRDEMVLLPIREPLIEDNVVDSADAILENKRDNIALLNDKKS